MVVSSGVWSVKLLSESSFCVELDELLSCGSFGALGVENPCKSLLVPPAFVDHVIAC